VISFDGTLNVKLFCVCIGYKVLSKNVSFLSEMCVSRDSESAIILFFPGMCCEYRAVSVLSRNLANVLATWLWASCFTGSKDAL